MVTGASTADVAVILIDGRKGVLTQTRRHSYLVSLLGIRHVLLAINKLDLVDYSREVFDTIEADYRAFAAEIGLDDIVAIPLSALEGDNITEPSPNTPWYHGPTLIGYLETVEVADDVHAGPFRMPVQWVNRPDLDFRGFSGQIVGGSVRPGDRLRILPSGRESTVARIVTADGDLDRAASGQSVTITLTDEVDVSRGDVLAAASSPPGVADQFECHLIWMSEEPMLPGRPYQLKLGTRTVGATVARPKYKVNVNTLEHTAARRSSSTRSASATSTSTAKSPSTRTARTETWAASSSSTDSPTRPSPGGCCTSRCVAPTTCTGRPSRSTSTLGRD